MNENTGNARAIYEAGYFCGRIENQEPYEALSSTVRKNELHTLFGHLPAFQKGMVSAELRNREDRYIARDTHWGGRGGSFPRKPAQFKLWYSEQLRKWLREKAR